MRTGVIHSCRKNNTGDLRVIDIDAGQTCAGNETALNWNQTGPQGPAGPQGPPGPAGALGYEYRSTFADGQTGLTASSWVACPPGKRAVGGGGGAVDTASAAPTRDDIVLISSAPVDWNGDETLDTWRINTRRISESTEPYTLRVWAICVS